MDIHGGRCRYIGARVFVYEKRKIIKRFQNIFGIFFIFYSTVLAAPPTLPEQTQILREQDSLLRQQQQQQDAIDRDRLLKEQAPSSIDIKIPIPVSIQESAEELSCFEVNIIAFENSTLLSSKIKAELTGPYLDRCITLVDIEQLVDDVTHHYIDNGFVTSRAFLQEQDISQGQLSIHVLEGQIYGVQLGEGSQQEQRQIRSASPVAADDVLNIRDIEQTLDQLNRLSSNNATVELIPAERSGGTDVKINNTPGRTWRVSLGADNSGQSSTGTVQRKLRFEKDNLFDVNDLWVFNYSTDNLSSNLRKSRSLSALMSVPWGYWTLTANSSYFEYVTPITGLNTLFETSGDSFTYTVKVNRILHRDKNSKTSIDAGLTTKKINNFIEGNRIEVGSRKLAIGSVSINHSNLLLGGVIQVGLGYERGLRAFSALKDPDNLAPDTPEAQFDKYTLDLNYQRPISISEWPLQWQSQFHFQHSDNHLYGSEQLSLGSQYTVQGFKNETISGDTGGYLRNSLHLSLPSLPESKIKTIVGDLSLSLAHDVGAIKKDDTDTLERGFMQGIAAGIHSHGKYLTTQWIFAKAISSPGFITQESYETYFNVALNY
ncbi:MAG: ShlB/FhaC/HecB family hemolysin secretion/activation protein [Proteobacteria bacterium]|nr:ShlB/FhaC/HecB family hemolysin secretion/activation protein [Pseudomonadota bacterium]NOG59244.1 ShlB/FhaC/HecB family hemolysin secretion/activation protein [Pseudomonadota bacterium]